MVDREIIHYPAKKPSNSKLNVLKKISDKQVNKDIINDTNEIYEDEDQCCYMKNYKNYNKKISNFIIEPMEILNNDNNYVEEIICKIKTTQKTYKRILTINAFTDIKILQDQLKILGAEFYGTKTDLQYIKTIISKHETIESLGVNYGGIHYIDNKCIFVSGEKAIDSTSNEIKNIKVITSKQEIETTLLNYSEITKNELKNILPLILNYNIPEITINILLYPIVCLLRYKINKEKEGQEIDYKTPLLNIVGERGSGKSETLEQILYNLVGAKIKNTIQAAQATPFTVLKDLSSNNAIPYIFQEIKSSKLTEKTKNLLSNVIRTNYDGYGAKRGTTAQTTNCYNNIAPLIFVGESGFCEAATQERFIILYFSKQNFTEEREKILSKLQEYKIEMRKLGKKIILKILELDEKTLIKNLKKIEENKYMRDSRINRNLSFVILALDIFQDILKDFELNIELTKFTYDELIKTIIKSFNDFNTKEGESNKSNIDLIIEFMDYLVGQDKIIENIDYKIVNNELRFKISNITNAIRKGIKDYNNDELEFPEDFSKQIKFTNYYVDDRKNTKYKTKNPNINPSIKSYALDLNKMKHLNLENILIKETSINQEIQKITEDKGKSIDENIFEDIDF